MEEEVQVVWSVVENYSNYWVGMRSEVVNMKQRQEKSLISSSSEPVPTFQSTTYSKNLEPLILNTKHPIYEG